jgi:hypothetical protein
MRIQSRRCTLFHRGSTPAIGAGISIGAAGVSSDTAER